MKVSNTYESLVRGVSQQFPQDRRPGQMQEQVNMLPDPVVGLTRRRGSVFQAEARLGAMYPTANLAAFAAAYRRLEYTAQGKEYILLYRFKGRSNSALPPFLVYNKTDNSFLSYTRPTTDAVLDTLEQGGVSAITAVGKYVFIAGNSLSPTATSTDRWGTQLNQTTSVVWIRGGTYARTFELRVRRAGQPDVLLTTTTPSASYPGVLNTASVPTQIPDHAGGTTVHNEYAGVNALDTGPVGAAWWAELQFWALGPTGLNVRRGATAMTNVYPGPITASNQYSWNAADPRFVYVGDHPDYEQGEGLAIVYTTVKTIANPDYAKQVNDITSAYNQAVTQWIGTAAAAIQPAAIATKLYDAAVTAGLSVTLVDSHLRFNGVTGIDSKDGGDGSFIRVAGTTVDNIDDVTLLHNVGHVVKVTPNQGTESFYLKAVAKTDGDTGFARVQWVEGAAVEHNITGGILYGVAAGNKFYVASSAAGLNSLLPGDHPVFAGSRVGDNDTSPLPSFIGRTVTYLDVFQDRLVVGAGGVLSFSRSGDYLNFFRQSVLTLPSDDTLDVLAQGADDDELRYGVLYDRSLVIFGKKRQYMVSGRNVLTPVSANMPVLSSHEGAAELPPVAGGSLIFYAKQGEFGASLWQVLPGEATDSPRSYSASSQLDDYIKDTAVELTHIAKPSTVLVRTTGGLFALSYVDGEQSRMQDAWHRLEYSPLVGQCCGIASVADGALMFFLREAQGSIWVVADYQSFLATRDWDPRLDSQRDYDSLLLGSVRIDSVGWDAVYPYNQPHGWIGTELPNATELIDRTGLRTLRVGAPYNSYVTLTNPYLRDRNEKPITIGRLTVTRKVATLADTADYYHEVNGVRTDVWRNSDVGKVETLDRQVSIPVGRETRSYTMTIGAQKWLPLTITGIEWVGQYFNRAQRP